MIEPCAAGLQTPARGLAGSEVSVAPVEVPRETEAVPAAQPTATRETSLQAGTVHPPGN